MTVTVAVTGAAAAAVERHVPQLVADGVAGRITTQDSTLWGPAAEDEASKRLGWTEAVAVSEGLVDDILALREDLLAKGISHFVLGGMGGSSLAPEVITSTYGVALTVLDSTDPAQVRAAIEHRLAETAVVISSKSGSTVETDSQKRVYEQAFRDAGIDPTERIIVVTDPGSPLDESARADGYRVFNADPNVGGRFSALTAFGPVPSGLAGIDVGALLDDAEAVADILASDDSDNPALILGAVLAGTSPLRDKIMLLENGTDISGFGDWAEQLIAESTGKDGKGVLPVVVIPDTGTARVITYGGSRKAAHVRASGTDGARVAVCQVDGARWSTLEGIARVHDDPQTVRDAEQRYAQRYRVPRPNPDRVVIVITITRRLGNV